MYGNNNGYNGNRNNNRNNGGYNNNRGGNGSWGNNNYNNDGYNNNYYPYEINEPVRHIATGTKLIVISYGREQIECRKPDLSAEYFYPYELEPFTEETNK